MSYESKIYSTTALNALNAHLYQLASTANERLDQMYYCGCFFCGRRDPEVVKQFLFNGIHRLPVCVECDKANYTPNQEAFDLYG